MIGIIVNALVATGDSFELSLVVKATAVAALALLATRTMRRARASVRHLLLAAVFIVLLAIPFAAWLVPAMDIEVPILLRPVGPGTVTPVGDAEATVVQGPAGAVPPKIGAESMPVRFSTVIAAAWAAGAILFALPMAAGMWQLRRIRRSGVPWLHGKAVLRELVSQSGITRRIDVLMHDAIAGPRPESIRLLSFPYLFRVLQFQLACDSSDVFFGLFESYSRLQARQKTDGTC